MTHRENNSCAVTKRAATHIFIECFVQYEVLSEADPGQLAEDPRMMDYVFDFDNVAARVLTPVELKLFKLRVKYRKRPTDCLRQLHLTWGGYWYMKKRIRIKLGRGFHDYRLWPLEMYFDDNHEKKVEF